VFAFTRGKRSMAKPLVFISHIHEEVDLAVHVKTLVDETFLGMMDTFVSSDDTTIKSGARWLDEITNGLKTCAVEVILLSPASVHRPWINFEAGAGWVRNIPVIPVCHSGLNVRDLPIPLTLLNGTNATDADGLRKAMATIGDAIGANLPKALDLGSFVDNAKDFEDTYTFWSKCNDAFRQIKAVSQDAVEALISGQNVNIQLPDSIVSKLEPAFQYLEAHGILSGVRNGSSMGPEGIFFLLVIKRLSKFPEISKHKKFRP